MMKQITMLLIAAVLVSGNLTAQGVAINTDGSDPNSSAILDIQSSGKGILIPRLSNSQIATLGTSLDADDKGMIVFNADDSKLEYWDGSSWKTMVTKTSSSGSSSDGTSFCSEGVTDYDGHKYKTVKIGDQCWMAENLRSNHYANGSSITEVYNYANEYGNGLTYGYLYSWAAVMNGAPSSSSIPSGVQGVCPDGWHVPSDGEWKLLEMTVGMTSAEADVVGYRGSHSENRKLKETEDAFLWTDDASNRGTNNSGFTALPGGARNNSGVFFGFAETAYFWCSTQFSSLDSWYRGLWYGTDAVQRTYAPKTMDMSVRCVQN